MARALLVTIAALCCLGLANAFPWLFVDEYAKTCTSHPTVPDGGHRALLADPSTSIVVLQNGVPTGAACPGYKYQLRITFPQPRRALVTTTIGTLANGVGDLPGKNCRNRMMNTRTANEAPSAVIITAWEVPCGASGQAVVQVTSATSASSAFLQLTGRVPVLNARACRSTCPLTTSG